MTRLAQFVFFGILVMTMALASPRHAAASDQVFSVINDTPWQVDSVFVRPTGGGYDWSDDVLGSANSDILPPGDTHDVDLSDPVGCMHDIEVFWHGDTTPEEFDNLDFCAISKIEIWYNFDTQQYRETHQ